MSAVHTVDYKGFIDPRFQILGCCVTKFVLYEALKLISFVQVDF